MAWVVQAALAPNHLHTVPHAAEPHEVGLPKEIARIATVWARVCKQRSRKDYCKSIPEGTLIDLNMNNGLGNQLAVVWAF